MTAALTLGGRYSRGTYSRIGGRPTLTPTGDISYEPVCRASASGFATLSGGAYLMSILGPAIEIQPRVDATVIGDGSRNRACCGNTSASISVDFSVNIYASFRINVFHLSWSYAWQVYGSVPINFFLSCVNIPICPNVPWSARVCRLLVVFFFWGGGVEP